MTAFAAAVEDLKAGKIQGLVTAPLSKSNVNSETQPFLGHTEYLIEATGSKSGLMMLVGEDLRVGLVTGHIPLAQVPAAVTKEKVIENIQQNTRHYAKRQMTWFKKDPEITWHLSDQIKATQIG